MTEYCTVCQKKKDHYSWRSDSEGNFICGDHFKSSHLEWVPERIKQDRAKYAKDMIQPFREGELSKEFVDTYGTKHLKVTKEQVKKAKNVWGKDTGL